MKFCWICSKIADSEEHKFKASDLKRYHGKKMDAYYISGDAVKIDSYKDKILKFPKVICINCNNNLTRPHDNAYDKFVDYCFKNNRYILATRALDFEEIYGENWKQEKSNLYRYYAKHAGCKVVTSKFKTDLSNLATFINGSDHVKDFVLRFELKAGVEAIMNAFNRAHKYNHLYNSETIFWGKDLNLKLGGWLTNNFMTANWIYGKDINTNSDIILSNKVDMLLMTDNYFFEIDRQQEGDDEFSRLKFIDQYIIGFENGYNKTHEQKSQFFENLIMYNNIELATST